MKKIGPKKRRLLGESKRSQRLRLNVTAAEYELLERRAKEAGLPLAVYVRRVSLEGAVVARLGEEDRELFRKAVGVSNVLDDLYKLAKAEGVERATESFAAARDALDGLINKLRL